MPISIPLTNLKKFRLPKTSVSDVFSPISEEEVILKRITNDLKKMTNDIGGDIAGIGNNLMIISPSGVKIDRRKLRGKYA